MTVVALEVGAASVAQVALAAVVEERALIAGMVQAEHLYPHQEASYGTTQLQCNTCTHPRRVLHAFQMYPACVPDASHTCSGYVRSLAKKGIAVM